MSDIRSCSKCGEKYYIDNGHECMCCSREFCGGCDIENGFIFNDKYGGIIYICKDCIIEYKEKGMKWLKNELIEDFDEEVFIEALREYEKFIKDSDKYKLKK